MIDRELERRIEEVLDDSEVLRLPRVPKLKAVHLRTKDKPRRQISVLEKLTPRQRKGKVIKMLRKSAAFQDIPEGRFMLGVIEEAVLDLNSQNDSSAFFRSYPFEFYCYWINVTPRWVIDLLKCAQLMGEEATDRAVCVSEPLQAALDLEDCAPAH